MIYTWADNAKSIAFFGELSICFLTCTWPGEDIVFLATDINLPGAVDWVMMQSCFGHNFMLVLEKQEKYEGTQLFYAIVQLIGTRKQAENFAYRWETIVSQQNLARQPVCCEVFRAGLAYSGSHKLLKTVNIIHVIIRIMQYYAWKCNVWFALISCGLSCMYICSSLDTCIYMYVGTSIISNFCYEKKTDACNLLVNMVKAALYY